MPALYLVSREAQRDLFEIWDRIASDSQALADRIHSEMHSVFESLGRMPTLGHTRADLTDKAVRFFSIYSFLVIYQADTRPVRIVAVVRGKRNVRKALEGRS